MPACLRNVARRFVSGMLVSRADRMPALQRRRAALTKVELVVLITVIGVSMLVLLPAILDTRGPERSTRCLNNQGELAKAVLQYEAAKKQLPGYIEGMGQFPVSWATMMLPYLGHRRLYSDWEIWFRQGPLNRSENEYPLAVSIEQLKCPSDRTNRVPYPLSYVVNCGMPDDLKAQGPPDWPANGVFFSHDPRLPSNRSVTMTTRDIKDGAGYTLMLSENIHAGRWTDPYREVRPPRDPAVGMPAYGYCFQSNPPVDWQAPLVEPQIGIVWFVGSEWPSLRERRRSEPPELRKGVADFIDARPSSFYAGAVAATFCDAHSRRLRDNIDNRVYSQLMSSWDREVKLPGSNAMLALPTEWHKPLTESDLE